MIGRTEAELGSIEARAHRVAQRSDDDAPRLEVLGLGKHGRIEPYDLSVYPGQIVGFVGLLGSGRTEAVRLLFGADRAERGEVRLNGAPVRLANPNAALRQKIAFSSEDRK